MVAWTGTTDDDNLAPYKQRQNELSVVKGCVLWGSRVVVPTAATPLCVLHFNILCVNNIIICCII